MGAGKKWVKAGSQWVRFRSKLIRHNLIQIRD